MDRILGERERNIHIKMGKDFHKNKKKITNK